MPCMVYKARLGLEDEEGNPTTESQEAAMKVMQAHPQALFTEQMTEMHQEWCSVARKKSFICDKAGKVQNKNAERVQKVATVVKVF